MAPEPGQRDAHELPSKGVNAMRQYLVGMTRDVPAQLKRSESYRRQLRRLKR